MTAPAANLVEALRITDASLRKVEAASPWWRDLRRQRQQLVDALCGAGDPEAESEEAAGKPWDPPGVRLVMKDGGLDVVWFDCPKCYGRVDVAVKNDNGRPVLVGCGACGKTWQLEPRGGGGVVGPGPGLAGEGAP
jgi:hypothetical protein